jgi:DNA-binding transcriptional MerR regulator
MTDAAAGDVYRRARDQIAARTSYDVQAGLARLNEWMLDDGRDSRTPSPRRAARAEQGLLFGDEDFADPSDEPGYRGPTACAAAGITYRQLDYWARTGLVEPSVRAAHGAGSQRLYNLRDICVLKVIKRLLDTGISLQQIRTAVVHLRDPGDDDLARLTLMSDGVSVYECTSADEVIDLLAGGQGVFGIALGRIWREVDGTLAEMPHETTRAARSKTASKTKTTDRQSDGSELISREKASTA